MNKTILYGIGISTLIISGIVAIPGLASAQTASTSRGEGYQQMLQTKAELIGVSKNELIKQLETKTFEQIADEKNISEDKIHTSMQEAAKKRWAGKGLSESETSDRLERIKERQASDHSTNAMNHNQGFRNNHLSQ